jgi:hypothetical protein
MTEEEKGRNDRGEGGNETGTENHKDGQTACSMVEKTEGHSPTRIFHAHDRFQTG